jgi:hypothetical protein
VKARLPALLVLLLALLGASLPATAAPTAPRSYGPPIEAMSPYQGQHLCSPAAKPGVVAFRDLVLRSYPGTRSLGISRACTVGGRSEHKEGRAFDWGVNVARPAEKAAADELLRWLHATDRYGNRFANARRLGVQYVIWNRRIWSSYAPTWRAYGGPSPHTDHVHVSFNWPGANKQTSFWSGRVVDATAATVPSAPPAVTGPVPPRTPGEVAAPEVRNDQSWTVPANRPRGVDSPGSVRAGESYLLTVRGTWAPSRTTRADAKCWLAAGSRRWARTGPGSDLGDVLVNGRDIDLRPAAASAADSACDVATHTYSAVVTPRRTGVVNLRVLDISYGDNTGALTASLTRVKPSKRRPTAVAEIVPEVRGVESLRVPVTTSAGASTQQSYAAGTRVLLRVRGTWTYGPGQSGDAECSAWPGDRVWRAVSEWDPEGLGHLDLTVNGKVLPWTPFNTPAADCDPRHEYFLRATLSTSGPLRMAVEDDRYGDNAGALDVTVEVLR